MTSVEFTVNAHQCSLPYLNALCADVTAIFNVEVELKESDDNIQWVKVAGHFSEKAKLYFIACVNPSYVRFEMLDALDVGIIDLEKWLICLRRMFAVHIELKETENNDDKIKLEATGNELNVISAISSVDHLLKTSKCCLSNNSVMSGKDGAYLRRSIAVEMCHHPSLTLKDIDSYPEPVLEILLDWLKPLAPVKNIRMNVDELSNSKVESTITISNENCAGDTGSSRSKKKRSSSITTSHFDQTDAVEITYCSKMPSTSTASANAGVVDPLVVPSSSKRSNGICGGGGDHTKPINLIDSGYPSQVLWQNDIADGKHNGKYLDPWASPPKTKQPYRPVIIDGQNVARCSPHHASSNEFRVRNILIVLNYFSEKFKKACQEPYIKVVLPKGIPRRYLGNQRRHPNPIMVTEESIDLIDQLNSRDLIVWTPNRVLYNQNEGRVINIRMHDDYQMLEIAKQVGGIVVSRDQFRDHQQDKDAATYLDVITNRVLTYTFVSDNFIPPQDPLGKGVSTVPLDDFLRFDDGEEPSRFQTSTELLASIDRSTNTISNNELPTTSDKGGDSVLVNNNNSHGGQRSSSPPKPLSLCSFNRKNNTQSTSGEGSRSFAAVHPSTTTTISSTPKPDSSTTATESLVAAVAGISSEVSTTVDNAASDHGLPNRVAQSIASSSKRSEKCTLDLQSALLDIFPDNLVEVEVLLMDNPFETHLDRLANLLGDSLNHVDDDDDVIEIDQIHLDDQYQTGDLISL